jgi:hypothetical protein
MITKESYLEAKEKFIESKEILRLYKLQPKEKCTPIKKSKDELIEFLNIVFEKENKIGYVKMIDYIKCNFGTATNNSKNIFKEIKRLELVKQPEGNRGYYVTNTQ